MKKSRTKQFEIEYPSNLDRKGLAWLDSKPFGGNDLAESSRAFRDFATILYLLDQYGIKNGKILDLGSGPGWLAIFLGKMGFRVTGLDISPGMVKVATKRAQKENSSAQFSVCDIEEKRLNDLVNQNEAVIIYDALHHCHHEEKVLKNAQRYLKDGGLLILAEPNKVHEVDRGGLEASEKYGVLERGLSPSLLRKTLLKLRFKQVWRYHASGQSLLPRNESLLETMKMIFYPSLARFYFGRFKTRVWIVARK